MHAPSSGRQGSATKGRKQLRVAEHHGRSSVNLPHRPLMLGAAGHLLRVRHTGALV